MSAFDSKADIGVPKADMSGAGLLPCKLTPDPYSASASDRRSTGRARASDRHSTGPKFYLHSNRKCHDLQINRHRNGGKA